MTTEERYKEALERIEEDCYCSLQTVKEWAYKALNPPPEMEEVAVVSYYCPECDSHYTENGYRTGTHCLECKNAHKFVNTYSRPVKKKVKRREEIYLVKYAHMDMMLTIPKDAKFYAEWQE